MRITSGIYGGRTLATPAGQATRPTSDRTRQAVFNILRHADFTPFTDAAAPRVIDLFAGSGALGFEAISNGASFCLFVETDDAARGAIRTTIDALGLFGCTRIHRRDATQLGDKPANMGAAFDLVFADPPYHKALLPPALSGLLTGGWIHPGSLLVAECAADETLDLAGFTVLDQRRYGAAQTFFLRPISTPSTGESRGEPRS